MKHIKLFEQFINEISKGVYVDVNGDIKSTKDLDKNQYRLIQKKDYTEIEILDDEGQTLDSYVLHKDRIELSKYIKKIK
tara:strand:+ start:768 stop:1004 length:237 start_codon:yes stop_codon:yes gene_type:complete